MPEYLLAHDLGTPGNKATLFTTDGTLIQSCVSGYGTRYYNGNWAEQNPGDWWKAVCASTKELIQGIDPSDIVAVAFSGQMMGCLCVDKAGVPLYNSIIWADMRAQDAEKYIIEKVGAKEFFHIAGRLLFPRKILMAEGTCARCLSKNPQDFAGKGLYGL